MPQKLFIALITSVKDFVNLVPLEGSSLQPSKFHLFSGILLQETYETPLLLPEGNVSIDGKYLYHMPLLPLALTFFTPTLLQFFLNLGGVIYMSDYFSPFVT